MEDGTLLGKVKVEGTKNNNHVNQIGVSILYGLPTRALISCSMETLAPTTPVKACAVGSP
ncbi:hypothetical protein PG985_006972 [Apiospora marii]|uniref:Uncharacterized protein n=1 Tax=Apiospora marii TaxID=335849 RepID=A0ABR1SFD6_9PEZI